MSKKMAAIVIASIVAIFIAILAFGVKVENMEDISKKETTSEEQVVEEGDAQEAVVNAG